MKGAFLHGNSTVELKEVSVPAPGHGEVLLRMKASTICGSDIRCIYNEHLGKGPEGYQGVVSAPLTDADMAAIAGIDKNCRLIKGQVFLWKQDQTWEDLWDLDGAIKE